MNHENHRIANLAKRAYRKISPPIPSVGEHKHPPHELKPENWRKTTDDLHRPETPIVYEDNPQERHGPFVVTRGHHTLRLPAKFRMALYLVTNESFLEFVQQGGYTTDSFWLDTPHRAREKFFCQDGKTKGPSTWPSERECFQGQEHHPVAGISYYEALAYCEWLNKQHGVNGWRWCLPTEDMWEFTARTNDARWYPWGNEFKQGHCNSAESKIGTTTPVNRFPVSNPYRCSDMAGNVWEFVDADDVGQWSCVLRGGSFRNNKEQIRSYLRLYRVPREHRPPDFGFRCAQKPDSGELSRRTR